MNSIGCFQVCNSIGINNGLAKHAGDKMIINLKGGEGELWEKRDCLEAKREQGR